MVILDIDNPKTCEECPLCVYSSCPAQRDSANHWRYVSHFLIGLKLKDYFCPIMAEISEEEIKEKGIKLLDDYHGRPSNKTKLHDKEKEYGN